MPKSQAYGHAFWADHVQKLSTRAPETLVRGEKFSAQQEAKNSQSELHVQLASTEEVKDVKKITLEYPQGLFNSQLAASIVLSILL